MFERAILNDFREFARDRFITTVVSGYTANEKIEDFWIC
jgi:hypothetical protein